MNCEKAKELILSDAESGEKLEAHVASCKECRNLASAWASIKGIKPPDIGGPSRNLDFKIRDEAVAFLDPRKINHKVFVRRIFMYATAACSSTDSDGTDAKEIEGSFPDLSSKKQIATAISELT